MLCHERSSIALQEEASTRSRPTFAVSLLADVRKTCVRRMEASSGTEAGLSGMSVLLLNNAVEGEPLVLPHSLNPLLKKFGPRLSMHSVNGLDGIFSEQDPVNEHLLTSRD